MAGNTQLAKLIVDQVSGTNDITSDETAFLELLETALEDGRSRLDLRDKLFAAARDTNEITIIDITEVMTQSLSDEIRDLNEQVAEMDNNLVPSRLALGSLVGLVLGSAGTLVFGATDPITSLALIGFLAIGTLVITLYRRRAFQGMSALRRKRANYESFRNLLLDSK